MPGAFANLLGKLNEAGVRYLVVGGVAVCLHGYPRATQDMDILVEATPENARRLITALSGWGEGHASELSESDFCPPELGSVRVGEDFVLDIFTLMRSRALDANLDYAALAADAQSLPLAQGGQVAFASASRLIDLKRDSGRPKDEADVAMLSEILLHRSQRSPVSLDQLEPTADHTGERDQDQGEWPGEPRQ